MNQVVITKSNKPDKKFKAVINNSKTVHFGQSGASDMTQHKDEERKSRYIQRHKKNEQWGSTGFKTAGFYSKHILWNKPSLTASVKDVNDKFKNIHVKLKV
jgi:hypothetical protein